LGGLQPNSLENTGKSCSAKENFFCPCETEKNWQIRSENSFQCGRNKNPFLVRGKRLGENVLGGIKKKNTRGKKGSTSASPPPRKRRSGNYLVGCLYQRQAHGKAHQPAGNQWDRDFKTQGESGSVKDQLRGMKKEKQIEAQNARVHAKNKCEEK